MELSINCLIFNDNKSIVFREITPECLESYQRYLVKRGVSEGGISVYMRTIRAIFNRAIQAKVAKKTDYPFDTYKISKLKTQTKKRQISKSKVEELLSLDAQENSKRQLAQHLFGFSFYCRGMNFIDIANLTWSDLHGERLLYTRQKTGHSFNIKLHPKAQEILKYYWQFRDNSNYIFPIFSNFHSTPERKENRRKKVLKEVNKELKQMGGEIGVGEITFYVARHSYATHLKYSKVNTSMISEALGHKDEKITQVYLDSFGNDALDALDEELL